MPKFINNEDELINQGRVIARGMEEIKVEKEKSMTKATKRRATMLERAAEKAIRK